MSETVNLKRYRKRLAREAREQEAQANRRRFGRSKSERAQPEAENNRAARQLDGHKRDT
jgi:Domain of unknown function (DUF4169)